MPKSYLEEAAKSAHLLTEALRKKGYEAYEFHDRSSSIVTVGGFDSVGTKRADGKIEINPAIHTIMRTFGAETKVEPGKAPQVGKAKKLADIPFDVQPVPVEVPRRTISTDYGRTADAAVAHGRAGERHTTTARSPSRVRFSGIRGHAVGRARSCWALAIAAKSSSWSSCSRRCRWRFRSLADFPAGASTSTKRAIRLPPTRRSRPPSRPGI